MDLDRGSVVVRPGDGDFEFSRQVAEFGVQTRPLTNDLAIHSRIFDFIRGDASVLIGGGISNAVAAALAGLDSGRHVLVHHPLRSGVADRFLAVLADRLALPLLSFDRLEDLRQADPEARPVPLTLAPNRMTEALREAGGLPPLLEHSLTRQALIELLAALP